MGNFTSSLLILLLLTSNGVAMAENSVKSNDSNRYPEEFLQQYDRECMQTSMEEGLAEEEAERLCDCTINKFQSQYQLEEFKQITANSLQDRQAEETLVEVGQVCFEQILYE